ncbi:hypothetical protein AVEN_257922-1 [Araneus ventricosus]|uniref:Uncharacterized protein n=1 Tax=Araneus ventricosus TaxID=182803 RepID=A0A4Y2LUZ0_ARAVE|nr:hypothetical protein AVEN_257922-1 [Araneus ventricosus]
MILHGDAAWGYALSARQSRQLNSIQRKHLRSVFHQTNSHTPGYRRDHVAPNQSRTGSGLRENSRLRKTSHYNNIKFDPIDYEYGTTSTKFHPAIFQLEDKISL